MSNQGCCLQLPRLSQGMLFKSSSDERCLAVVQCTTWAAVRHDSQLTLAERCYKIKGLNMIISNEEIECDES